MGKLGFESVGQCLLVGRFFPQKKSKFGSTGPDSKLAERGRQENRQDWAARSQLPWGSMTYWQFWFLATTLLFL